MNKEKFLLDWHADPHGRASACFCVGVEDKIEEGNGGGRGVAQRERPTKSIF